MTDDTATKRPWWQQLYVQVLVAIAIGILLGHFAPELGAKMKPLGDAFIKLVKMIIAPVVFLTVVVGIAKMGDLRHVGRIGVKALVYFELVTTLALAIGLVVANVVKPGAGVHADLATLDTSGVATYKQAAAAQSTTDFLLHIVPDSLLGAFVPGDLLQVLFVAVLFGVALTRMRARGAVVLHAFDELGQVVFRIVDVIMRFAPIGAFGAMAYTIGKFGLGALASLGLLLACVYATCLLFIVVVLGLIARFSGFALWKLLRVIRGEILLVLGTSSSESALPRLMDRLEQAGCDRAVVGLVVPTGYSFNLDGTCIYLTLAAVFVAQALDIPMTLGEQLTFLAVLLLTSKGAA
ncbi:MAG TPA: C4-dicarboxylate transporter DctA, partial [Xanthomonadales bacterium]|nr:C4-dicarboxylate transporter DctA [Xanthomonadales bacterium]